MTLTVVTTASIIKYRAIGAGRVELLLGSSERLPDVPMRFDKVFAVNVYMFWNDPESVLRGLCGVMKPGGVIALTLQPRNPGATGDDTRAVAERMATSLGNAGFENVRTEILRMAPVDAACVLGQAPGRVPSGRSSLAPARSDDPGVTL